MQAEAASAALPAGWDCRYDSSTRRIYYRDLINRCTSWERPSEAAAARQPEPPTIARQSSLSVSLPGRVGAIRRSRSPGGAGRTGSPSRAGRLSGLVSSSAGSSPSSTGKHSPGSSSIPSAGRARAQTRLRVSSASPRHPPTQQQPAQQPPSQHAANLPSGWEARRDARTGWMYYRDLVCRKTQWDPPDAGHVHGARSLPSGPRPPAPEPEHSGAPEAHQKPPPPPPAINSDSYQGSPAVTAHADPTSHVVTTPSLTVAALRSVFDGRTSPMSQVSTSSVHSTVSSTSLAPPSYPPPPPPPMSTSTSPGSASPPASVAEHAEEYSSAHESVYLGMLSMAIEDGKVDSRELQALSKFRESKDLGMDFHIHALSKLGMTEAQFNSFKVLDDEEESRECIICFENRRNAVLLNCGHMKTCVECAEELPNKLCPVCREPVLRIQRVFQ